MSESLARQIIQEASRGEGGGRSRPTAGSKSRLADKGTGDLLDAVNESLGEPEGPSNIDAIEGLLVESLKRYARQAGFERALVEKALQRSRPRISALFEQITGELATELKRLNG